MAGNGWGMRGTVDAVDVELTLLSARDADPAADAALLAPDEIARMERFHDPALGRRWAAFRAGLRRVLGARLGIAPEAVPISIAPGGKPWVPGLEFSLSHCGTCGALAIAATPVGVDIERHDPPPRGWDRLARSVLSDRERAAFEALPISERPEALIRAWTAKEAVVKALGAGFAIPPCDVEIGPGGDHLLSAPGGTLGIRLLRFDPAPGVSGAVATLEARGARPGVGTCSTY